MCLANNNNIDPKLTGMTIARHENEGDPMTTAANKLANCERVIDYVKNNRGKRCGEISEATGVSNTSCRKYLNDHCDRWELPNDGTNRQNRFVWYARNQPCRIRGAKLTLPKPLRVKPREQIRQFLLAHPGSTTKQVMASTGLPKTTVTKCLSDYFEAHDIPERSAEHRNAMFAWTIRGCTVPEPAPAEPEPEDELPPDGELPWWWGVEIAELNPT